MVLKILFKIKKIIILKKKFFIQFIIFLPSSILLILITRALSLIKKINILEINFSRIADVYPLFWSLKVDDVLNLKFKKKYLIFINDNFQHNKTWFKLWNRIIKFSPFSLLWKNFFIMSKFFPGHKNITAERYETILHNLYLAKINQDKMKNFKLEQIKKISSQNKVLLKFNESEEQLGKNYLDSRSANKYSYICFHSRDRAYLQHYNNQKDWSYHDFRDSNIDTYLPAMEHFTKLGYPCFRMGSKVEKKIETNNNNIIDYASSSSQSDFLDVYIASKCFMAVYSESGISVIPEVFDRPIVYVNWPAFNFSCFSANSLVIPKKYFSKKKNRNLTFSEILELNFEGVATSAKLKDLEIDLIDNTPTEILDAAKENFERLNGNWIEDAKCVELQKKFWSLFNYSYIKSPTFRIGSTFLKNNFELIQ